MLVDYCPQTAGRGNKKRLSQWGQNHFEVPIQFMKKNFSEEILESFNHGCGKEII